MSIRKSLIIQRYCYKRLGKIGGGIAYILKQINRVLFATDISYKAEISNDCDFTHNGLGVVIGDGVVIGKGCIIRQNVTIGGKDINGISKYPVIGNNCMVGAGAVLIGDICVGDNVQIGANAVVLNDIPNDSIAVGIPAKVKKLNIVWDGVS